MLRTASLERGVLLPTALSLPTSVAVTEARKSGRVLHPTQRSLPFLGFDESMVVTCPPEVTWPHPGFPAAVLSPRLGVFAANYKALGGRVGVGWGLIVPPGHLPLSKKNKKTCCKWYFFRFTMQTD